MQTAGSLWNTNQWHWEEKSFDKIAVSLLTQILTLDHASTKSLSTVYNPPNVSDTDFDSILTSKFVLQTPNSCLNYYEYDNHLLVFRDVKVGGDASISVRKGKQIVAFDMNFSFVYDVFATPFPTLNDSLKDYVSIASGRIICNSFGVEDSEDGDFDVLVSHLNGEETWKEKVRKEFVPRVLKTRLSYFHRDLSNADAASKNIEKIRLLKAAELEKAKAAVNSSGAEQQSIYHARKVEESNVIEQRMEEKGAEKVNASVWNKNKYHWEQKQLSPFFRQELAHELFNVPRVDVHQLNFNDQFLTIEASSCDEGQVYLPCFGYDSNKLRVYFSNIRIAGEASSSVRKAVNIVVFDNDIQAHFKIDNKECPSFCCQGMLRVSNFTSEDSEEDWQLVITIQQFTHSKCDQNIFQKEFRSYLIQKLKVAINTLRSK